MTLFEISKEFETLRDLALDVEFNEETDEVTDNSDLLHDLWNSLTGELSVKLDNVAYILK